MITGSVVAGASRIMATSNCRSVVLFKIFQFLWSWSPGKPHRWEVLFFFFNDIEVMFGGLKDAVCLKSHLIFSWSFSIKSGLCCYHFSHTSYIRMNADGVGVTLSWRLLHSFCSSISQALLNWMIFPLPCHASCNCPNLFPGRYSVAGNINDILMASFNLRDFYSLECFQPLP